MKHLCWLLLFSTSIATAQKLKKADKQTLAALKIHIGFLADDKLEGRRTGTTGEQLAYEYIIAQFTRAGLQPKAANGWLQAFEVNDGKVIAPATHLIINDHDLKTGTDFFPLAFSANKSIETTTAAALQENGSVWCYDIKELLEENKNNPHFDLAETLKEKAAAMQQKGAAGLVLYNSGTVADGLKFEPRSKTNLLDIPVVYLHAAAKNNHIKDESATLDVKLKVLVEEKKRTGHNVVGYIDNAATNTVVIGAHYDHLGYGEDKNSLHSGEAAIHNGADDNASGTAAVLELASLLKQSKFKNNNYLFIAFSGEELGLYGSKYFTENATVNLSTVNYMINLDMVGRLNDSTHAITIGGYGTSPAWAELLQQKDKFFTIKTDSSGTGPSDHTSFYRKDIPVLFFFTGLHTDYHKPSDDASKINYDGELQVIKYIYQLIGLADKKSKLVFAKTREVAMSSKTTFKVSLGIMPDYTFSGNGVKADGVSEGKIAQKVGIKAGDIITQLGDYKCADVQTYMEALSKFKKGDATKVKVKRGAEELNFDIVF
jgi:aminopeptidase YwaD